MTLAHTTVDLTTNEFKFQGDSKDEGYLAFDTGWRATAYHEPAPAAEMTTSGLLKSVGGLPATGTQDVSEFRFGDGFAADRRIIGWPSGDVLFLAHKSNITDLLNIGVGQILCPPDTSALLRRPNPGIPGEGETVDLTLTEELCRDEG